MTSSVAVEGWYPDPHDARQYRWYDGVQWTAHVHPQQVVATAAAAQYGTATQQYRTAPQQYRTAPQQHGTAPQRAIPARQFRAAGPCQQCGASPALDVKLRSHRGFLFMQQFLSYRGTWCRHCGVNRFREVQKNLWLFGWWGFISFFVTWFNTFQNVFVLNRLRTLGEPQGRQAAPVPTSGSVFASPGFAVLAVLALIVGWKLFG